jgi:hypothetical protein
MQNDKSKPATMQAGGFVKMTRSDDIIELIQEWPLAFALTQQMVRLALNRHAQFPPMRPVQLQQLSRQSFLGKEHLFSGPCIARHCRKRLENIRTCPGSSPLSGPATKLFKQRLALQLGYPVNQKDQQTGHLRRIDFT